MFGVLNLDRQQTSVFVILISIIVVLTGILVINNEGLLGNRQESSVKFIKDEGEVEKFEKIFEEDEVSNGKENLAKIKVYITGAIKYPGVIEVEEGSRLIDVIELAGGMLEDADNNRINLALKVQDEGMYLIPKIGEEIDIIDSAGEVPQDTDKININKATQQELETLYGIGPAKSKAIIDYREENGPFKQIEDLKKVSGIGEKTFEKIRDSITVK